MSHKKQLDIVAFNHFVKQALFRSQGDRGVLQDVITGRKTPSRGALCGQGHNNTDKTKKKHDNDEFQGMMK
ncbi:MAG: hypothetical protein M3162_09765 [Thermoproteota archaeon]|nr:hypothetical protein [Thermoproteota archaeon]